MLSESALIHFYESKLVFSPQGATPTLEDEDARILEAVFEMAFWEPPKKKGNPPKLSKAFLRFQSSCFFLLCVHVFF